MKSFIFIVYFSTFSIFSYTQEVFVGQINKPLQPWEKGYLDIHAINTARGECTFFILPDGTTMLVDAGETISQSPNLVPQKPNEKVTPGETYIKYIRHFMKAVNSNEIDYLLLSHFHIDHMGEVYTDCKWAENNAYQLTGVTAVGDKISFKKVIDRGWPNYNYPIPPVSSAFPNYLNFIKWHQSHNNMLIESFKVGANNQVVLLKDTISYPTFEIRNIAANGHVWTGVENIERNYFIPTNYLDKKEYPNENMCSIAFRLSYGKFDYFSGGDLPAVTDYEWQNLERPIGFATGPIEACKSNHHMNYDSMGLPLLRALRPQVVVIHNCKAQQPDIHVLRRILSSKSYPGKKSIFSTNLHEATPYVVYPNTQKMSATQGHIVIRVQPGGNVFFVYVLDDTSDNYNVLSIHGPYKCN